MTKKSHAVLRMPRLKLLHFFIAHIEPRIDAAISEGPDNQAEIDRLVAVRDAWIGERDLLRRHMVRRAYRLNRRTA